MDNIRNFVIIAHIDHGKSTLADRFLELTGTVEKRKMREQFLDTMELEREKGITIKMQPVRMIWHLPNHSEIPNPKSQIPNKFQNSNFKKENSLEIGNWKLEITNSKQEFILNLIDTPGHVDFTYEVSRALACVEGAILLVDATQGVQAQTIANLHLAKQSGLVIIPAINKIDLAGARIKETEEELVNLLGVKAEDIFKISGKTGEGVEKLLEAVVEMIPSPIGLRNSASSLRESANAPRALIFDSHFDNFRGIIAHVRVFNGECRKGEKIFMMATKNEAEAMEVGYFNPGLAPGTAISTGEIGYVATGLKEPDAVRIGDTIIKANDREGGFEPLFGYRQPKPMVFASIYPEDADDYEKLRDSLKKTKLNDASIFFEPEASDALGRGFRAGFLGMLHMEIIGERLKREYGLTLVFTTPSVAYEVIYNDKKQEYIYSASRIPDEHKIFEIKEPWVKLEVITLQKYLGSVMNLLNTTRGLYSKQEYLGADRLMITYETPLKDILTEFFDGLKSVTEGYGSMGYELLDYRKGDLNRLDILIAGEKEEAFSQIVPRVQAYEEGRTAVKKLKELLPKQLFQVSIQAAVSGKIIARETIPALKKDVTGYLYGGDRTRKMKLWKKQKRGKERLKAGGRVEIPPDVFLKMLKR